MSKPNLAQFPPRRVPSEESTKLYPGLVVDDDRVSGSITMGRSRLPLWCLMGFLADRGWRAVQDDYPQVDEYGWDAERMAVFLHSLMEQRGEFGRLLLVLADVERRESKRNDSRSWWDRKKDRKRVIEQMRRCITALGGEA